MKITLRFCSAVVILLLAACSQAVSQTPTPPPTATPPPAPTADPTPTPALPAVELEDVVGLWAYAGHLYLQFTEDHTFAMSFSKETLGTEQTWGEFTLEGNTFTFIYQTATETCEAGGMDVYEIELLEWERIEFTLIEGHCLTTERTMLTRLEPLEDALLGFWRFKDSDEYFIYFSPENQVCQGDTVAAAGWGVDCNSYTLEGSLLTETCGENNPDCTSGDTCQATVEIDVHNSLSYQVLPGQCDWGIHLNANQYEPHIFYHHYLED